MFASPLLMSHRARVPSGVIMKCLIAFGAVRIVTLPFLDNLRIGEIPLLTIVQLPKADLVHWLLDEPLKLGEQARGSIELSGYSGVVDRGTIPEKEQMIYVHDPLSGARDPAGDQCVSTDH